MDDYSAGAHGRKHLKVGLLRLNSVLLKLLQQSSADHLAKSPTPLRLGCAPEGRVRQPSSDTHIQI